MWKTNNSINDPKKEKGGWPYLAVNELPALLKGITSKNDGDSYCLNCLLFYRTKNKFTSHEKVCKNNDFCGIVLTSQTDNQFYKCMKSNKVSCII